MKFRCTLNFLIPATLAGMDTFLNDYNRKDRDNEAGSSKVIEASSNRGMACKILNAANTVQNVYLLDSQILMIEKRGHIVYFVSEFSAADSMKPTKC